MKKILIIFVVMAMILPLVFSLGGCGQEPATQDDNQLVQQTKSTLPTEQSWSSVGIKSSTLTLPKTTTTTTENVPEAKTEFGDSELSLCFNNANTVDFNKMMNQCYKNMNAKCDSEGNVVSMADCCSYNAGLGCYIFDSCYVKDDNQLYNVCLNYYEKDCTVNGQKIAKGTMTMNVYDCQKTISQQNNTTNDLINNNTTNDVINNNTTNDVINNNLDNNNVTDNNTTNNTDNQVVTDNNTNTINDADNSVNNNQTQDITDNQTNIDNNQTQNTIDNQTNLDNNQSSQLPQDLTNNDKVDDSQILPVVPTLPQEDNLVNGNSDAPVLETPTENTNPDVSSLPAVDEKPLVEPTRRIRRADNANEQPVNRRMTYEERRQKLLDRQQKINEERLARQTEDKAPVTTQEQVNEQDKLPSNNLQNSRIKPTRKVVDDTARRNVDNAANDQRSANDVRRDRPISRNPRTTLPVPARNTNLG